MSNVPESLLYTQTHEWVQLLPTGRARIGITDHAQSELSDVVFFSPCETGDALNVGDQIGDVESIKAVSSVYTPIAGTVTAVNSQVEDDPSLVNSAPYDAWLVELDGLFDTSALLDSAGYEAFLAAN